MSRLHGVDVSGWDEGIDCAALTADFVIVKSTEGLQGTIYNPTYRQMADATLRSGKLLGFFHYANGEDPVAEAEAFYESIKDYRGRAVACLDWEDRGNPVFCSGEDVGWCLRFLDRIAELMGGTPLFYTNKTTCNAFDWSPVAAKYPLWGAEYAYEDYTWPDYLEEPWESEDPWGAWGRDVALHQYGYVNPQPCNGGIGSLDGEICYRDRETWLSWCKGEGGGDMSIRDRIVELAKSQIGSWYYSMNYSAEDGWGGMGTHEVGEGWGCAQHASFPYNVILGTSYVGSCWNFAGDALGQSVNQGGGEWEFTDNPLPGDIVLYIKTGHDGRDYDDYAHAGVYIGDGRAVSALGQGTPYDSNYRGDPDQGWGIQEHSLDYCFRWGTLDDYRFIRCKRLDDAPKPEPKPEPEIEEENAMQCMIQCDDKIYYWDGSPECVPYHVSPSEKAAIEEAHKKVTGKDLVTISMARDRLNALVGMGKARKAWREQPILDAIKAAKDAVIAKVEELLGKVE